MNAMRLLGAVCFAGFLASCVQDDSVSVPSDGTRPLALRVLRTASIDTVTWNSTDSVHVSVATTSGTSLLEKTLPFRTNYTMNFGTITAPSDQGVKVMMTGSRNDTNIWNGDGVAAPSTSVQTVVVTIQAAKYIKNLQPSAPPMVSNGVYGDMVSPDGGVHNDFVWVKLASSDPAAVIYYTLNDTPPDSLSPVYHDSLLIDTSCYLRAIAISAGLLPSAVLQRWHYTVRVAPVFVSLYGPEIHLACATPSAKIHYTLDGRRPTSTDSTFDSTKPPTLSTTGITHLQAIAFSPSHPRLGQTAVDTMLVSTWNTSIAYGALTDPRDGQVYKTVKIGPQTWMAQNLNYVSGKSWCYESDTLNCRDYGRLYSWTTALGLPDSCDTTSCKESVVAKRQGVCPADWHVPSDSEWTILVKTVEADSRVGKDSAGLALMSTLKRTYSCQVLPGTSTATCADSTGWSPNGGTDLFGFRAMPGGSWDGFMESYSGRNGMGQWWSATELNTTDAGYRFAVPSIPKFDVVSDGKASRFSVRCVAN